ncbi:Dihydroneopterin aldolase [Morus notabilis]|uniref:dihydroneopterin aldolase n=1 Tax=Morus notabilis TaxID=981085 RepID=W9RVJ2_9ROSA|nr:Dihydroneopterin aldolase [Morus notabilis]
MLFVYELFCSFSDTSVFEFDLLNRSIAKEVVEGQPHNLLESVAQLIASTTLTKHPQISAVRVKVGKPHVAVHGPVDYLGVEILRYRSTDVPN